MGQVARSVDRKLLAEVNLHLDRLRPDKARETGRDITVFRNAPGTEVFKALASVDWVTPRGKKERSRQSASGRGPDAANLAVKALLAKLADPDQKTGEQPTSRRSSPVKAAPQPKPKTPARARPLDRGMVTAARRLLGYLVPEGATKEKLSVIVAKRSDTSRFFDATATATWTTASGRAGTFTTTASGDGLDAGNIALAHLLAKLERAPIGAQKKRGPKAKR